MSEPTRPPHTDDAGWVLDLRRHFRAPRTVERLERIASTLRWRVPVLLLVSAFAALAGFVLGRAL